MRFRNIIFSLLMIFFFSMFFIFPENVTASVRKSAESCLYVIIPSLYAMMVLSDIYIKSGLYKKTGKIAEFAGRYIFKIPKEMMSVFIVSLVSGYPVGANLIVSSGLDKKTSERLMCFCFGAGPAFIFSSVSANVFGNKKAGIIIFISMIISNILAGFILSFGEKIPEKKNEKSEIKINSEMIIQGTENAGKSILKMCFVILFMNFLTASLESVGLFTVISVLIGQIFHADKKIIYDMLKSIFDVTNLVYLKADDFSLLPFVSALVSFGGISVFMQIKSVLRDKNLSVFPMIITRIFCGCCSFVLSKIFMRFIIKEEVCAVSVQINEIRHNSLLSSAFLFIMTILLLSQKKLAKE